MLYTKNDMYNNLSKHHIIRQNKNSVVTRLNSRASC